jgi:hypothetical protein
MKKYTKIQLYSEPQMHDSGNDMRSEKFRENIYLPELYSTARQGKMQSRSNELQRIDQGAQFDKPGTTCMPPAKSFTFPEVDPVNEINTGHRVFRSYYNIYLRETAARLSEIELAIDNYDGFMFQCTIHSLIRLFGNMNLPVAMSMTHEMEIMAAGNKLKDVLDQLQKIKKVVAEFVGVRQHAKTSQ